MGSYPAGSEAERVPRKPFVSPLGAFRAQPASAVASGGDVRSKMKGRLTAREGGA